MSVAALLLAAGRSVRFGAADKLAVPLDGLPLGLHAARALAPLTFAARIVVTGVTILDWPGFERVANDRPEDGMARSLALGVAAARRHDVEAVLVALADMPFVPTEHLGRLLARHRGPASLAASSDGVRRQPPALLGAEWFDTLEALSGDQGARVLLDRAETVAIEPRHLRDIDRPEDIAAASRPRHDRGAPRDGGR